MGQYGLSLGQLKIISKSRVVLTLIVVGWLPVMAFQPQHAAAESKPFQPIIGVIKHDQECFYEELFIQMDDEDDDNTNEKDMVPNGITQSKRNTKMTFCAEPIGGEHPPIMHNSFDYAVLRLSDECPTGTHKFRRRIDNEDDDNDNKYSVDIAPSLVDDDTGFTRMEFCFVPAQGPGWNTSYPWSQNSGVFAKRPPNQNPSTYTFGFFKTDDEDDDTNNSFEWYGMSDENQARVREIIKPVQGNRGENTRFNTAFQTDVERSRKLPNFTRNLPRTIEEANAEFDERLRRVVLAWLQDFRGDYTKLGHWKKNGSSQTFRRIAAGLLAMNPEILPVDDPLRNMEFLTLPPSDFPQTVEKWLRDNAERHKRIGTDTGSLGSDGDFDFYQTQIITLLYAFKDVRDPSNPDDGQFLLTKDAIYEMIWLEDTSKVHCDPNSPPRRGCIPLPPPKDFHGVGQGTRLKFKFLGDHPETENHVLMIHAYQYLANQWIREHGANPQSPRFDDRIKAEYDKNPCRYANLPTPGCEHENQSILAHEDILLQALGRIVWADYFETNARPYLVFSMHPIMNLAAFAESERLRTAAQNALDYTAAKFAFSSLEGKKHAPQRRHAEEAFKVGLYQNNYEPAVWGMLSGGYVFNDSPDCREKGKCLYKGTQFKGAALWAALISSSENGYKLPRSIHDFMLNKYNGFWSTMRSKIRSGYYEDGDNPKYFVNPTTISQDGNINTSPELYFVTLDFVNASGGMWDKYRGIDNCPEPAKDFIGNCPWFHGIYDFTSRPTAVITKGDIGHWKTDNWLIDGLDGKSPIENAEQQVMMMLGDDIYYISNNIGTYKNFAYGYSTSSRFFGSKSEGTVFSSKNWTKSTVGWDHRRTDFPMTVPMTVPDAWNKFGDDFTIGQATFRVFDLTDQNREGNPNEGFYVITAHVNKSASVDKGLDEIFFLLIARGFWEVVPKHMFPDSGGVRGAERLRNHIKASNPQSHFNDDYAGMHGANQNIGHYSYRLASTGEVVKLNQFLKGRHSIDGGTPTCNPIKSVSKPDGTLHTLSEVQVDLCNDPHGDNMPLINVMEVDQNYQFTGRKFAFSNGNGLIEITNPYIGESLTIDSMNYKNPTNTKVSFVPICFPPKSGNWDVREICALEGAIEITGNVVVHKSLVITGGSALNIDFKKHHLLIKSGAKVVVKNGGKIF